MKSASMLRAMRHSSTTVVILAAMSAALLVGEGHGQTEAADDPVTTAAVTNTKNAYGADFDNQKLRDLPIGVFDSGTGGLTVLEQILTMDEFDNRSFQPRQSGDGQSDFTRESFIFLADQANMPYGNYPIVKKAPFLDDLIVKDAQFLLGRHYFFSPEDKQPRRDKLPVKAIVIACNTATAYGKPDIERVIQKAGLNIRVIGVIDAGAKGAVKVFADGKPGSIGVVPTKGTVLSNAYPTAIRKYAKVRGLSQQIDIFQQGAFGLAGAIDGAAEFVSLDVSSHQPREGYRGPSLTNADAQIEKDILPRYGFDFAQNQMLYAGTPENPSELQLNSAENYIAYHVVTLLETVRKSNTQQPLRAIILGCTHFPFFKKEFRSQLDRLYDYKENGQFVYRKYMAQEIKLIDPAYFTARELYQSLAADERIRTRSYIRKGNTRGEFFITMPCRRHPPVDLTKSGAFTYQYKYGRSAGQVESAFRVVPLTESCVGRDVMQRLEQRVPTVWNLMDQFRKSSPKLVDAEPDSQP